jgi:hypothetical protein
MGQCNWVACQGVELCSIDGDDFSVAAAPPETGSVH